MQEKQLKPLPYSASKKELKEAYKYSIPDSQLKDIINQILAETRTKYSAYIRQLNTKEICLLVGEIGVPKHFSSKFRDGQSYLEKLEEIYKLENIKRKYNRENNNNNRLSLI